MSAAFTYRPLQAETQEIRLLDLGPLSQQDASPNAPATRERALQCSLRHVSLRTDPKPVYETVSYCWGDTELSEAIEVDGCTLKVPKSAIEVLTRLALPDRSRTLWIDAVCIDQTNKDERGHQVTQMRHIYRHGATNVIYLGDDHPLTARALQNLSDLHEEITSDWLEEGQTFFDLVWPPRRSPRPPETNIDVDALSSLYSCPWFTRLWVFQEAVLAAKNIAVRGNVEFGVDALLELPVALSLFFHEFLPGQLRESPGFSTATSLWLRKRAHHSSSANGVDLDRLLDLTRRLDCSDAHDRVFGVLGLTVTDFSPQTAEAAAQLLEPDYTKPIVDVLRDATRFCVIEDGRLSILGNIQPGNKRVSWALAEQSFGQDVYENYSPPRSNIWSRETYCDLSRANMLDRCGGPDKLHVYGFNVGVVVECSTTLTWSGSNVATPSGFAWSTIHDFLSTSLDISKHSGNTIRDLGRAMTANRDYLHMLWPGDQQFESLSILQQLAAEEAAGVPTILRSSDPDDEIKMKPIIQFFGAMVARCQEGRVFSTSSGVLGHGPAATQLGDIVAFFYSAGNPCVLHPIEGNTYSFLGECYINTINSDEDVEKCRIDNAAPAQWYTLA